MANNLDELKLLRACCEEKPNEYRLLKDLLRLQKKNSLQLRQHSIRSEAETIMDNTTLNARCYDYQGNCLE